MTGTGLRTSIRIRPMETTDIPALRRLELACFSDPWSEGLLAGLLDSGLDEAWVVETERGELAGYANFRFLSGEGELMRIAVESAFRGRGYAKKLMERLIKSAEENGAGDLTLEVRAGNTAALELYQSFGFCREAIRKNYYHAPTEDAVIMWRRQLPGITT